MIWSRRWDDPVLTDQIELSRQRRKISSSERRKESSSSSHFTWKDQWEEFLLLRLIWHPIKSRRNNAWQSIRDNPHRSVHSFIHLHIFYQSFRSISTQKRNAHLSHFIFCSKVTYWMIILINWSSLRQILEFAPLCNEKLFSLAFLSAKRFHFLHPIDDRDTEEEYYLELAEKWPVGDWENSSRWKFCSIECIKRSSTARETNISSSFVSIQPEEKRLKRTNLFLWSISFKFLFRWWKRFSRIYKDIRFHFQCSFPPINIKVIFFQFTHLGFIEFKSFISTKRERFSCLHRFSRLQWCRIRDITRVRTVPLLSWIPSLLFSLDPSTPTVRKDCSTTRIWPLNLLDPIVIMFLRWCEVEPIISFSCSCFSSFRFNIMFRYRPMLYQCSLH